VSKLSPTERTGQLILDDVTSKYLQSSSFGVQKALVLFSGKCATDDPTRCSHVLYRRTKNRVLIESPRFQDLRAQRADYTCGILYVFPRPTFARHLRT
jgi:hypothetical protein